MSDLKLKFDATLEYQQSAIASTVELFTGLPAASSQFSFTSQSTSTLQFTELGVGNPAPLDEEGFREAVLGNLRSVQERNGIIRSAELDGMNFSIEMETGTGKTYVYLRTIFELNKQYGFTKFVIVVPNIAIREGVLASIELLADHFRGLYGQPFDRSTYDSKQLGRVRQFATANTIQILVMNIQAFQRDAEDDDNASKANIINRAQDKMSGRRPIEFIQATRPVVIIDEPQNMESDASSAAIEKLQPFCTLRYSATHAKTYNQIYRLGPLEAYDLQLVKRIEVASAIADENYNAAYIRLLQTDARRTRAQIQINFGSGTAATQKKLWVKQGDDLAVLSDGRQEYADGYIVDDISFRAGAESVTFANGKDVTPEAAVGSFDTDVKRAQIFETVRQHLDKERLLNPLGIKVLSLFFIDKVANYRSRDEDGNIELGPLGQWFEEAYAEFAAQPRYASLKLPPVAQVHDGYFSVDGKGNAKDTRGTGEADSSTYDLIMKDKEKLLSMDEPLRFIFSHTALREGWDNPNVFQICTLNESRSTDRKRQEIGRGLRLPVDQNGERIHDPQINRLTVIANEAYDEFARALQTEYEKDTGKQFGVLEKQAFALLTTPSSDASVPTRLGQEASAEIWNHLLGAGYINERGVIQASFEPGTLGFELSLPDSVVELREEITDKISEFVFTNRVADARKRKTVSFQKHVSLNPDFVELWERIKKRTKYRVTLSSEDLIKKAAAAIAEGESIQRAKIRVKTVEIGHTKAGLDTETLLNQRDYTTAAPTLLPDILADLQNETDLTRATLVAILKQSGRLKDFTANPQAFLSLVTTKINATLRGQMVQGIAYESISGYEWEMHRLEPSAGSEIERYATNLYEVQQKTKTLWDQVEIDSEVERRFAKGLDQNEDVKFFMKLPAWFTVDTPIGQYNPDWAIVFEGTSKVYLVRETKGTLEELERRHDENVKIRCARKHFKAIGVDYGVTTSVSDLVAELTKQ